MKNVKVWVNEQMRIIPLEDYLDITARKYGFEDYCDLQNNGLTIDVNPESIIEN